jgi:hypothetical protein
LTETPRKGTFCPIPLSCMIGILAYGKKVTSIPIDYVRTAFEI